MYISSISNVMQLYCRGFNMANCMPNNSGNVNDSKKATVMLNCHESANIENTRN